MTSDGENPRVVSGVTRLRSCLVSTRELTRPEIAGADLKLGLR